MYFIKFNKILQIVGGKKLVIHISGTSGSGKTTLGKKLKKNSVKQLLLMI